MPAKGRVTRQYSEEEVDHALKDINKGLSQTEVAKKHGIPTGTINGWIKRHKTQSLVKGAQASEPIPHISSADSVEALRQDVLSTAERLLDLASNLATGADHLRYLALLEESLRQVASLSSHARGLEQRVKELENRVLRSAVVVHSEK